MTGMGLHWRCMLIGVWCRLREKVIPYDQRSRETGEVVGMHQVGGGKIDVDLYEAC